MNRPLLWLSLFLFSLSCQEAETDAPVRDSGFYSLPSEQTGVDFENRLVETDSLNILDYLYLYNGGGVGIGDLNNDGLPDIYLSGNQGPNKLYLNKGQMKFEEVSQSAGVMGESDWNTGVLLFDVNDDGLLDIYVTAVVGIAGFEGRHELFVNNGDMTFTERAEEFGLDARVYGTTATVLDYDNDGDLDVYLLNHAVHTQESFGRSDIRAKRDSLTGDRLMRNDNGRFVDVSEEAGIYGGVNGYGLGVSVADFNADGYPDLYIGNDFHEDDYFYLNNGDGTFTESLKEHFGHSSRFSMGNDAADINGDGLPDLISLDMLPWEEQVLKSSEGDDTYQTLTLRTQRYGYHYQFTRNMLFTSRPGAPYQEVALLSGVAATDWSWSALFADFDQDGQQDLVISNGIPRRPNNLDFIRFLSNEQIQQQVNSSRLVDQQALGLMPSGQVPNKAYKGNSGMGFEDVSEQWFDQVNGVSGATAMGDLDGDGDLDLVINNINSPANILENRLQTGDFLRIRPVLVGANKMGVGTKAYAYTSAGLMYRELQLVRGFQATTEAVLHFGLSPETTLDSLKVVWPNGVVERFDGLMLNSQVDLSPGQGMVSAIEAPSETLPLFGKKEDALGITYEHISQPYVDFGRQKLIPYGVSNVRTPVVFEDLDQDGKKELFIGGNKQVPAAIFGVASGSFSERKDLTGLPEGVVHSALESGITDDKVQLWVGTAGGDIAASLSDLATTAIQLDGTTVRSVQLDVGYENTAVIRSSDVDGDGDPDLFIGNRNTTNDFGAIPPSYMLRNDGGQFVIMEQPQLVDLGMVTDALWSDLNADGQDDLIVVGEWMSPRFFLNRDGQLEEVSLLEGSLNGLWQTIRPLDMDGDGDLDFVLGNWGLNSKLRASADLPLRMYYSDFDQNGSTETVIANGTADGYYPHLGLDDLAGQMVFLRKRFNTYADFAGKTISDIFTSTELDTATVFEVHTLASGFLRNNGSGFTFVSFPDWLQSAPVRSAAKVDVDGDGSEELILGGNYVDLIPYHGRLDAFEGAVIHSENEITKGSDAGLEFTNKVILQLLPITLNEQPYLLALVENGPAEVYQLNKKTDQ